MGSLGELNIIKRVLIRVKRRGQRSVRDVIMEPTVRTSIKEHRVQEDS